MPQNPSQAIYDVFQFFFWRGGGGEQGEEPLYPLGTLC